MRNKLPAWPAVVVIVWTEKSLFTQQPLLAQGSAAWEDNVFITDEISRLEQIVRDFLAFARPTEPRFQTLKATQPMRDLLPLLKKKGRPKAARVLQGNGPAHIG